MPLTPGVRLGAYELLALIGTGGMSACDYAALVAMLLTGEAVFLLDNVANAPQTGRAAFSVSQTGVLAYTSGGNRRNAQFTRFSRAGQQLATVGEIGPYSTVSISPDERSIVSARVDPNGSQNLWVMELARNVTTRLTFG